MTQDKTASILLSDLFALDAFVLFCVGFPRNRWLSPSPFTRRTSSSSSDRPDRLGGGRAPRFFLGIRRARG